MVFSKINALVWVLVFLTIAVQQAFAQLRNQPLNDSSRPNHVATPRYDVAEIEPLAGTDGNEALCVNNEGDIVGYAGTTWPYGLKNRRAFLFRNGKVIDLGLTDGFAESIPTCINDKRQITVNMSTLHYNGEGLRSRGYIWRNNAFAAIYPRSGFVGSEVSGINNVGDFVGTMQTAIGGNYGFLSVDGKVKLLGSPGKYLMCEPMAINDSREIVGAIDLSKPSFNQVAFATSNFCVVHLGSLGGVYSRALGINNAGRVVGEADTKQHDENANAITHAFIWNRRQGIRDIGTLGGTYCAAYSINDHGAVVGQSDDRAFLWVGGNRFDLTKAIPNGSGWRLDCAYSINNLGEIVGVGTLDGQQRAFMLTPAIGH